jgi:large conductance mechanosensitive channel
MLKEFKKFMDRGNVIDLSVAVVMGAAFGKITTSFVNDIIMPMVGILIGGINFTNLTISIGDATINYGIFIQNIIDFLIIGFCIFMFVRAINHLKEGLNKPKKGQKEEKVKTEEIILLEQIRDLLKTNKKAK